MNVKDFALLKHGDQKRKYTGEPYWKHLEEVAWLVSPIGEDAIWAAWLHDTLEDTNTEFDEIKNTFGVKTAERVLYLSDLTPHSEGNRAYRKAKYRDFLATCESTIQSIKVADLISNTPSICAHDPEFAKVYIKEKKELLEVLTRANGVLLRLAKGMIEGA